MNTFRRAVSCLATLALAIVLVPSAWSQSGTSSVTGTVTDQQGNAVAGASVTLTSAQESRRSSTTGQEGNYVFRSLLPGEYRLEVEAPGFKKSSVSAFRALVDSSATINVSLEVGAVSETVNVESSSLESIVNTQDASLGNNFVAQQILELPIKDRNVAQLLSLQPGVTPDGSVNGGRADQANITLDGIDVNDQQTGLDVGQINAFSPVIRVNPDNIEEFRVTTSNPEASKGRSSGAQVSLITKSGTNDFRGAVYAYHRNDAFSAGEFFDNAFGLPIAELRRSLYGGRLGGPVVKDRLFFFYNYDALRETKGTTKVRIVPSATLAQGIIRFYDNTGVLRTITTAQINSFTLTGGAAAGPVVDVNPLVPALFTSVVGRYPINAPGGDELNTGGHAYSSTTSDNLQAHTGRFDWNVTGDQRHQVSFRANIQGDKLVTGSYYGDTPATSTWSHPWAIAAAHTWQIKGNVINRFSYGLTRVAFSNQGDSADPNISFRYIYQPSGFARTFNRTNPTQNYTDDVTWVKGNHTLQFGTNIRLINNSRTSFARSFDNAITNPSAYQSNVARTVINQFIRAQCGTAPGCSTLAIAQAYDVSTQGALVALLGRLNGYGASFNFDTEGKLLPAGEGITRKFKTEEYDFYAQDSWKIKQNLTLTTGLRYGLSMPVTETQGYETVPTTVLSDHLRKTIDLMNGGVNNRDLISVRKAGKANGLDSIYPLDKNNLQPRVSIAWSPEFEGGFLGRLLGKQGDSVFRAGFAITNDYFGQQLATNWDGANTLGFSSTASINVNTYNITTNPAPLYTGPNQNIRTLPNLVIPGNLTFPQTAPVRAPGLGKIETSLDQNLVSPVNYSWNISYGRRLPAKMYVDVSYVARLARNLLTGRDTMMLRGDIRDPLSGLTYNQAATQLDILLQNNTPIANIAPIAFFENMWAPGTLRSVFGCGGVPDCSNTQAVAVGQPIAGDWTYLMQNLDQGTGTRYFFQGQYDALSAFGTVGKSDYHGATLSLRQRMSGLTWDLNYTYSKSLDYGSGLQTGGLFASTFVLNAFKLTDQRSFSDFDLRHNVNFNSVWEVPVGRGRRFATNVNKFADLFLGGWSLASIVRWDSGYPFDGYYDATGWQTNWQIRSYMTRDGAVQTGTNFGSAASTCTGAGCSLPNLFSDPDAAADAFRTPHPGETGSRNTLRYPGAFNLDASLYKTFNMPWKEGHKLTLRWDTFNVTNTPSFDGQEVGTLGYTGSAPRGAFGRFNDTRYESRRMQFALRYDF